MTLLRIDDLTVSFGDQRAAVTGISLAVEPGERVGIIGESGSGKSVTALAVMGLLPEQAQVTGTVELSGIDVTAASERERGRLRGSTVSMVFQEPMTALDPLMKVGRQVGEALTLHQRLPRGQDRVRVIEMLGRVGLHDPVRIADAFPHQLSGGQRQRCILAMALINTPALVLFDEPTTALDVTVQDTVLTVIDDMLTSDRTACVFISHDLAVVARMCERIVVLLDGRVVEEGNRGDILRRAEHPYTRALVDAARIERFAPGEPLPTVDETVIRHER